MSQDNFLPYISPPPRRLPPTPTPPGSVPPSSYPSRPLAGGTTWQSTPSSPSSANSSSSILVPPRSSPWTHPSRPLSLSSSTNMSGPYPPTSYRDSSRGSRRPDSVDFSLYPYHSPASKTASVASEWSPNPADWGPEAILTHVEPDDIIHNPDPKRRDEDYETVMFTPRGFANVGCLLILAVGLLALFAGYPLISYYIHPAARTLGGYNLGGANGTGQVPEIVGGFSLIDVDTPASAHTKTSLHDGSEWQLVFSDEFNRDGRSFYPGDDPYWEAVDLHYWQTNNIEWYDPVAITTQDGHLNITLSKTPTHDLDYQGGLLSSWNKFCFTGGYMEVNVSLPGDPTIQGLWPAIWTMGNLGRAGYGASLEGLWPYSYDSCDVGTLANQTLNGQPEAATINGDSYHDYALSYLPGQRLSACTCEGEIHPGPKRSDGTFIGRSAPEIDIFEALVSTDVVKTGQGLVSQSAQWAPMSHGYIWYNTSDNEIVANATMTSFNAYTGGVFQQASSMLSITDSNCYTETEGCYSVYGMEYQSGYDGYISWVNDNRLAWTIKGAGMAADPIVEIGARPIPQEPMYMIMNLGMSQNFGAVDLKHLNFPVSMLIDYVRVYQPKNAYNIGCSPKNFPTEEYINKYQEAYTNPNLTTWAQYGQTFPKNSLIDGCSR